MSNQRPLPAELKELRILLVRKTGVGKTSVMKTLLGRPGLNGPSASSETTQCHIETGEVGDQRLVVIDTPGLMNTKKTEEKEVTRDIVDCIAAAAPGPHVFLLVLQPRVFSKEDTKVVEIIQKMFGEDSKKYTLALFTRGDKSKLTDEEVQGSRLSQYIVGHHSFDNTGKANPDQVHLLLEKINLMVQKNQHYTSDMLKKAQEVKEQLKGEGETPQDVHEKVVEAISSGVLGEPWYGLMKTMVEFAVESLRGFL